MEAKAEERWRRLAWRGNAWCPWKGGGARGGRCVGKPVGKEQRLWSQIDLGLNPSSTTNQLGDHE